jgi:hypothetical protein
LDNKHFGTASMSFGHRTRAGGDEDCAWIGKIRGIVLCSADVFNYEYSDALIGRLFSGKQVRWACSVLHWQDPGIPCPMPAYDLNSRATMIFGALSQIELDPKSWQREMLNRVLG